MNDRQLPIVNFAQAVVLKELGFDLECNAWYYSFEDTSKLENGELVESHLKNHNDCEKDCYGGVKVSAPTVALALKWLRDVKGITHSIGFTWNGIKGKNDWCFVFRGKMDENGYDTYESAESALLDAVIASMDVEFEKGGAK